jgi:hypothetical protein
LAPYIPALKRARVYGAFAKYEQGFTVNNNTIRDRNGKVVVTVNFFQNQKELVGSQIEKANLMTQEPGTPFCGAIAAINAIRLSYDQKKSNNILDDFSDKIFQSFPDLRVLYLCHKLKLKSEAEIKLAQGFNIKPPNEPLLDDLNGLDMDQWWRELPQNERHIMAMHAYLSGNEPALEALPRPSKRV